MVKNSLRFDTEVPAVPWRLLSESGLLVSLCTYRSFIGSIWAINDLRLEIEDVQVGYVIVLVSTYHREICMPSIYIVPLIKISIKQKNIKL